MQTENSFHIVLSNLSFLYNFSQKKFENVSNDLWDFIYKATGFHLSKVGLANILKNDRQKLLDVYDRMLRGELPEPIEFRLVSAKSETWIRVSGIMVRNARDQCILGIVNNISDEKASLAKAQKFSNQKNIVLNLLRHELRGPLAVAHSLVKFLSEKFLDPRYIKGTQSVSKILEQSIAIIEDVTDREFIEICSVKLLKKTVNISARAAEYFEETKRSKSLSKRKFLFKSSPKDIFLALDEPKFMIVLNNLLSNSLKFSRPGDTISLEILRQEDAVHIIFSDTGIGIPQELQPLVFEKYSAAGRPGLNGEPSTGLGLYIVKSVIEWHGGTIECRSDGISGTTFFMEFPRDEGKHDLILAGGGA